MRPFYADIISEYEKFSKNKHDVDFDNTFKEELGEFLEWLDNNRVTVWNN